MDFIKTIKHASGQNYIVGSNHDIVSLECASDLVVEYWPDSTKDYTFHANRPLSNQSYHPAYLAYLKALYGTIPESISLSDERLESIKDIVMDNKYIGLVTIKDALSKKPICNSNTYVSTIMVFDNDYSELMITPGKPDSTEYIVFGINK